MYFSDEVGALVFDAGHYTFRAGYAGEEFPKVDLPSDIGIIDEQIGSNDTEQMDTSEANASSSKPGDSPKKVKRFLYEKWPKS